MRVRFCGGLGFISGLAGSIGAILLLGPGCGNSSPTTPTPPPTTCTYQLTAVNQSFGPDASTAAATVTTAATCSWTARVEGGWLSIGSGASGTGPGTITVAIAPNTSESAREGMLIVADQSLRLTQQGRGPCDFTLAPEEFQLGPDGGSRTASLTTGAGCAWTVVVTESWLTVSPMSGTGNATLSLQVPPYPGIPERRADLMVGGRTLRVDQDGDISACSYSVAPTEFNMLWYHTGGQVTVTAQAGCPWTVTPGGEWLEVTSGPGGDGAGTILFRMSQYLGAQPRTAPLEVRWPTPTAGQNVWVTQRGCLYAITTDTAVTFPAAGGQGVTGVIDFPGSDSMTACPWTAVPTESWIRIVSGSPNAGQANFTYEVLKNESGATRVGFINVMTEVLTITQLH